MVYVNRRLGDLCRYPDRAILNETEQYIFEAIKSRVWSGFYDEAGIHQLIDDILEQNADEPMLRACVPTEFEKKQNAELTWPKQTACDRLNNAFESLNSKRIVAIQNAGYTMSDGLGDVGDMLHQIGRDNARGYCFYHGQDLERAVKGDGLMLAFGDLDDTPEGKIEIGDTVSDVMRENGFDVEWNRESEKRISLQPFDWHRRNSG